MKGTGLMDERPAKRDRSPRASAGEHALALSIEDAAAALSVSRDSFERHVMPGIRVLRVGRRLLVPRVEIERWIEINSAIPLIAELPGFRQKPNGDPGLGAR